jgi:hypothetical protein
MEISANRFVSSLLAAIFLIAFGADSAPAKPLFSYQNLVLKTAGNSGSDKTVYATKPKKQKKAKGKKGGGVTFYEGSAETRTERDRRLRRECRGRPNSGACEGYTR